MAEKARAMTGSNIRYLLTLLELQGKEGGVRCVDLANRLQVTKPSVHTMVGALCDMGLAEKKRYGSVYLTQEGRSLAEQYAQCFAPLHKVMSEILDMEEPVTSNVVCTVLAQIPDPQTLLDNPNCLLKQIQAGTAWAEAHKKTGGPM